MSSSTLRRVTGLAIALVVAAAGCGVPLEPAASSAGGGGGETTTTVGSTGGPPIGKGVTWSDCPLFVDQPDGPQAECATIDVPLRWSEPDGPTIGIFVQRLRGTAPTIRGQLWLLEGGPGGSGADFDAWMDRFRKLDPTLDLYAVDHRGVGRSARLGCPDQETAKSDWGVQVSPAEAGACRDAVKATWGDDLAEFTTTAAARDLGRLIDVTQEPGRDVFVYGVSYGTYWAHRYLQVHPDQATAVVLDSIAPPGDDFVQYDSGFDRVAHDLMNLCAADTLCASKLGADPWAALGDLSTALSMGHCPSLTASWGLDASTLRSVLASLLIDPKTRTYVPALVYRYARCEAADVTAIEGMLTVLFGSPTTTYYDTLSSDALFYNVALSELWPNPNAHPTSQEIDESEAGLYVTTGLTPRVAAVEDVWPVYPDDSYVGAWAQTGTPLLMMNGDLDPMTPIQIASQAKNHFNGQNQQFFTIPRAAHAVTLETPVAHDGDTPCGMSILVSFLANPKAPPDTGCIATIPPESFTGDPAINLYLLGTKDLWENGVATVARSAAPPPGFDSSVRRTRRWFERHARLRR